jgi:hypothetical protein
VAYVFQRLERVKERLYADPLQDYLDAPRQAWYLRTTATYLTKHLLEVYRRHVEDALNDGGPEAVTPRARRSLKCSTDHAGRTLVQVRLGTADTARLAATLTKMLQADDQENA